MTKTDTENGAIVLFDGICNLCNRTVRFVVKRDRARYFKFASLQSDSGKRLLNGHPGADADLTTIVLIENGRVFDRSSAVLRIVRRLSGAWPLLYGLMIIPRPLRDWGYGTVSGHRYGWFGTSEQCDIPTPGDESRFL